MASPCGKANDTRSAYEKAYAIIKRLIAKGDWSKKTYISICDGLQYHGDSTEIGTVTVNTKGAIILKTWTKKKYKVSQNGNLTLIVPKKSGDDYGIKGDWRPFGL